ncbi:MAG TPA: hypothetical protein VKA27_08375, partial [Sunxiuqinia sp.]|nr:hypothetical protein [Sunxiuqinia sp.]
MKGVEQIKWNSLIKELSGDKKFYWISFFIGIVSGLAALVLKSLIHVIEERLVGHFQITSESYWLLAFPLIGIFITVLIIHFFIKDDIGHGVARILASISNEKGKI